MKKIKIYFCFLLLALLIFPIGNMAIHELSHLSDEHCEVSGTHFCATEHSCKQCDYIVASTALVAESDYQIHIQHIPAQDFSVALVSPIVSASYCFRPARAPPSKLS